MATDREYEIILWGATGFTGRLVADYLSAAPSAAGLRWAIAGRNPGKLDRVVTELGDSDVGVVLADADDEATLHEMAARATVICTTVGPYLRHGARLVAACVDEGTHYCDLTGEVPFIREMIDAHHHRAVASQTRIVNCCGFDSIPSDLGVLMMHGAMSARGKTLARVDALFGESKGKFSGGTISSLLGVIDRARAERAVLKMIADPYSLDPRGEDGSGRGGPDGPDARGIAYDKRVGRWTAPFLMAPINTRVVRRTNAITDYSYGPAFRYSERMSLPGGVTGFFAAAAVAGGIGGLLAATQLPLIRPWLESKLPASGDGPSRAEREAGYFVVRLLAESTESPTTRLAGRVSHDRDPGYGSTRVMLSEAALSLARDPLTSAGGILTPASAMGAALLARLRAAGMTFSVDDVDP